MMPYPFHHLPERAFVGEGRIGSKPVLLLAMGRYHHKVMYPDGKEAVVPVEQVRITKP